MSDIEIEIDGKKLSAAPNAMVIQVADEAGIYIPRFCYHKHLSIAANCRMCLVEVDKVPKALPACATPVTPGMKVFTKSPKALAAQKAVMEFLLINHPLDCPICDQGGECELQDLAMGYGDDKSAYLEGKRSVKDKDIGPLIETEMTRCIQCTRCVRFGAEVAGMRELGATGRGENMEIGTYIEHAMKSEVSGNVIDICPVGALTSKPYRFTARAWELEQRPSVAPHDCINASIYVHTRFGKVMRVVPRENDAINQTWISDRDRFSYEGLYHQDRLEKPLIKRNGEWQETSWQEALEFAATQLQNVRAKHTGDQIGALVSPSATLEEFYLLQKLMRQMDCNNIDHRLRQVDFSDEMNFSPAPGLGFSLQELEDSDVILLVGSNIQREQPSAFLRVRKATLKGAKACAVNFVDYPFSFDVSAKAIVKPDAIVSTLGAIARGLLAAGRNSSYSEAQNALAQIEKDPAVDLVVERLLAGQKVSVVVGSDAFNHPEASMIRELSHLIAELSQGKAGCLLEGGNAAGAWLAGAVPHRTLASYSSPKQGLNTQAMLQAQLKAYVMMNVEPEYDFADATLTIEAMKRADFVLAISIFKNASLEQYADVILPMAPFTETSGTFINACGEWQKFAGVAAPFEESRPAWKILRVLGNLLHLDGFDYVSSEDVSKEIKAVVENIKPFQSAKIRFTADAFKQASMKLQRIGTVPIYATDSIVRRAKALQAAQPVLEKAVGSVRLHSKTARELGLSDGTKVDVKQSTGSARLYVMIDDTIAEHSAYIPCAIGETSALGELFGEVEIKAVG